MGWRKYPWFIGKLFALAFIFFGGGILACCMRLLLPLIPGNQQKRTQYCIHIIFRGYLNFLQYAGMLKFSVSGQETLQACAGKVVIANHPGLLDVVALMAYIPRAQCIVKHQLWNHPFLGPLMRTAGFIRNDLEPEDLVDACKKALGRGQTLIIFPEGTRTPFGGPLKFHRGFANIAILAQAPIQTVLIRCTPQILYKGEPWWRIPQKRPHMSLNTGIMISAESYSQLGKRSIATRKLMDYLQNYYRTNFKKI